MSIAFQICFTAIKATYYPLDFPKGLRRSYFFIREKRTATRDLSNLVSSELFDQIGTTGKGTEYILRRHKDAKDTRKRADKELIYLDNRILGSNSYYFHNS